MINIATTKAQDVERKQERKATGLAAQRSFANLEEIRGRIEIVRVEIRDDPLLALLAAAVNK